MSRIEIVILRDREKEIKSLNKKFRYKQDLHFTDARARNLGVNGLITEDPTKHASKSRGTKINRKKKNRETIANFLTGHS